MTVIDMPLNGQNIKKAVRDSGKKASDVATQIGLSDKSTLYKYMRGSVMPSIDMLVALSAATGTSLDTLVGTRIA